MGAFSAAARVSCLLSCLALLLSGCGVPGGGSEAACGRGLPTVEPSRAAPGETFRLSGGGFGGGCDDSNAPFRPDPPEQDIRISMRQGGKTWGLATVDAGGPPRYAVDTKLRVPTDAKPGRAAVVVPDRYGPEPMEVPFRVLGGGSG